MVNSTDKYASVRKKYASVAGEDTNGSEANLRNAPQTFHLFSPLGRDDRENALGQRHELQQNVERQHREWPPEPGFHPGGPGSRRFGEPIDERYHPDHDECDVPIARVHSSLEQYRISQPYGEEDERYYLQLHVIGNTGRLRPKLDDMSDAFCGDPCSGKAFPEISATCWRCCGVKSPFL